MTKYRKKVFEHVEVKETYQETKTICDFCGRDVKEVSAKHSSYDYTRIKVDAKIGASYPEGDSRQGYRTDVCGECFVEKLIPAIQAAGGVVHEYDVEDSYWPNSERSDYWELDK